MTKEESDFIESIVKWEDEKRSAFVLAKRIFEEEIPKKKPKKNRKK